MLDTIFLFSFTQNLLLGEMLAQINVKKRKKNEPNGLYLFLNLSIIGLGKGVFFLISPLRKNENLVSTVQMLFNIVLQLIFSLIFRCRNFWSIFHSPFPVLHPSPFSVSNLYEMNKVTKVGLINFQTYQFQIKASFFHSTPALERKRRTHWDYVSVSFPLTTTARI